MKVFSFLAIFTLVAVCAGDARAEGKMWIWGWGPSHWRNLDFEPYLQNGKDPHNSQWNEKDWKPEYWTEQRSSDLQVLRGFYFSNVIKDQYFEDDIPVLAVGPNFYKLSGYDKRRITKMFDDVYGITEGSENGMFLLYDGKTEKPIGAYTKHGLQIQ